MGRRSFLAGALFAQNDGSPSSSPLDRVPRKQLGVTGAEIPILCMGGSQRFDDRYDRRLHRAFQEGVTYIDTSITYSNGQGHASLAPFIEQVGRENLWITSKVRLNGHTAQPEEYLQGLEGMLPDLRTDYLDMFYIHAMENPRQLDPEFLRMGEEVKKRGLAKFFGFSTHAPDMVEIMNKAASIGAPQIDCIQFRYNFAHYGDYELNKAIDACKKAGIGLIAMKTQGSVPEDSEEVQKFQSGNFNLHQAKLKAVWADERIDAAVSEMENTDQVAENVAAAKSTVPLTMQEAHALIQYGARTAHKRCLGCGLKCESQVDAPIRIADTLRYLMYADSYGKADEARTLYNELRPEERTAARAALEVAAQACPQGINIAQRLDDAARVLG
jgi:uncharacterized protein